MCVSVYACLCVYVSIFLCVHACLYVYLCVCMYMGKYVWLCVHSMCVCVCMYVCVVVCMCGCVCVYTCMSMCMLVCAHMCLCMCVCVCKCMCMCECIAYTCVWVYVHMWSHAWVYVHVNVCTCVCVQWVLIYVCTRACLCAQRFWGLPKMLSQRSRLGMEKVNCKEPRAESGFIVCYHNKGPRKLPGIMPPFLWPGHKQSWQSLPTFCWMCQELFLHWLSSQFLSEREARWRRSVEGQTFP